MSKKSRKRNKKILGLLAAGLGAAALMKRRGTAAANVDSGRGGDSSSAKARVIANAVTGTGYPGANKVIAAPAKKSNWISPRMRGPNPNDPTGEIGQNIRANYAKNARINAINTAEGSPMIDNPYRAPVNPGSGRINWRAKGGSAYKSGGRVKGCGKAKRGFGRALKKGK
jgi:hypothetical protein